MKFPVLNEKEKDLSKLYKINFQSNFTTLKCQVKLKTLFSYMICEQLQHNVKKYLI